MLAPPSASNPVAHQATPELSAEGQCGLGWSGGRLRSLALGAVAVIAVLCALSVAGA